VIPTNLTAINTISGYEDFEGYFVSDSGEIWSMKRNNTLIKLKDGRVKTNKAVWIYDKTHRRRCILVGNLVAKAFLPNISNSKRIKYKSKDRMDCSVNNVTWEKAKKDEILLMDKKIIRDFKMLYKAVKLKGYSVPTSTEFLNQFLKEAMENYINARGLRKILYQMENG
jgi:hypothetical protein